MCKSKFIKIRITVNPRQKCTICGQISLTRVSWKGTTLPINVKAVLGLWGGGGREGAGPGVGIWHFSKIWRQIPRPQANHSSQMHQNFPELISFIRVATVREKSGKNENFSRSGKVREFCFLTQCIKVVNGPLKAKLNLSERFQPDGVFCFENRASVYFDTAVY